MVKLFQDKCQRLDNEKENPFDEKRNTIFGKTEGMGKP
jgi:hypothetical protein